MTRRSAPLIPALLALLAVSAALVTLRRCTDRGEPELPVATAATDAEDRPTSATEPTASTRAAARLGAQLLGRIVDDQGAPIRGALVTLVQSGREHAQITARTDASGAYDLRGLPTGPLGVRAAAAGHATMQIGDLRPDRARDQRLVVRALQLPRAVRIRRKLEQLLCVARGAHAQHERLPLAQRHRGRAVGLALFFDPAGVRARRIKSAQVQAGAADRRAARSIDHGADQRRPSLTQEEDRRSGVGDEL